MTAPRQVLPGSTYLVSRRCSNRQFLLRPSKETTELFGYLLAVAASRFHIEVHAYCMMSNHFHLAVTDPEARLPAFSQFLNSLVARSMNALLGRWEHFWSPSSYSAVALQGPADVVDKVAYLLANPVAAGLVRHGRLWPGFWSAPDRMGGEPLVFKRPARFFRKKGTRALPETASLALVVPPGFGSRDQFLREVDDALEVREEDEARKRAGDGRGFLGVQRVLAQRPTGTPAGAEPRRGLNPRIACRDKWRRIQALGQLLEFVHDHHMALKEWRAGARRAVFPAGTYLMRVLHAAPCAAPA